MECSFRIGLNRTSLTTWLGKLTTMGWRRQPSQGRSTNEALRASEVESGRVIPSPEPSATTFTPTDSNSQHLIGGAQNLGIGIPHHEVLIPPPLGFNGMQYRLGELFSGPGGMSLGAMMAEFDDGTDVHKIVHQWASDYDKDSCQTYTRNICPDSPDSVYHCDVRDLDISSLAPIDILAFGFPCNDFSIVGETKGMDGKFGMLYQYGVKVLEEHNPMAFVAENVSGIKGANGGKAWQKITTDLEKAGKGYDLYVHHYYFEHYGVPQMRHRYIIVGIRKDLKLKFQHPEPSTKEKPLTCYDALHNPEIPKGTSHHEIRELQSQVQERLSFIKPGDNAWSEDIPLRLRLNVKGARLSNIYRRMHPDLPAYTITGSGGGGTHGYHWSENRALTNREKARVQTFPDSYEFVGGAMSVRKQIGMAVPPVGAKIIFEALLEALSNTANTGK